MWGGEKMYRELDVNNEEDMQLMLRIFNCYACLQEHAPIYTAKQIKWFYDKMQDRKPRIFYNTYEDGKIEEITAVMIDYGKMRAMIEPENADKLLIWGCSSIGLEKPDDLRYVEEQYKLLTGLMKEYGKTSAYVKIRWKDYKPEWIINNTIPKWRDILEEIASKYFKDFKVVDEEYIQYELI